ncbi:hypothetical protein DMN91_000900 [Ooceraea biroi]|uniref:Tyrosine-protein phosphatase domain-containing protein n=1 Tax=Ooceraea biroi TaxID=2015173 RepID=A0A3L8E2Y8_OOCBI|nr:hypothetical protein DMN91_000900 [Ooceraea biroi]
MRFYNVDARQSDEDSIDCKMDENDDCLQFWIRENWNFTNSFKTPLGPVFDRRWEDFQEYENFNMEYDHVLLENTTAFSFSVRGVSNNELQIIFCNGDNYTRDFCYWIIIGTWGNTRSVVRRCPIEVPKLRMEAQDEECRTDKAPFSHNPLSLTEWRTYLVMWNITNRSISLYDPSSDNVFIRYEDMKQPKEKVEECEMDIVLYDRTGNIELKSFLVKGSTKAASHGLPSWQFITIKHSTTTYDRATMKLTSKLNSRSSDPLWAVANVRQCPRRNDNVVCPEGRIGPNCLLYCESDAYNYNCKEHVICYEEGCTCPPGFRGENCALYMYKPEPPKIDTVGNTTIQVNVPVEWKDEYKGLLEYAFIISSSTGNTNYTGWKRVFQNMTELTERFTNLESGVIYNIACIFRVCNQYDNMCSNYIQSNWRTAETVCNRTDFVLESEEHSLLIDWKLDPKQPFPCPATWYRIIVQVIGKRTPLLNTTVNHFPYKVSQKLPSYTSFTVTIVHEAKIIFSDDIRTLEEVLNDEISPRPRHEAWLIPVILILIMAAVLLYLYRRKRQTAIKLMLHTDIPLSHNIENYEHERHSVISNSEQSLSTLSDRQSRVTSYHHYEEIKEITWIVKVKDFDTFVKQAIETGLLNQQCEKLPKRHTQSCVYGKLPQNIIKNRCENLVPNDDTRVVLKQLPSDPHSDYINANYITGYRKKKHYIATQGPKPNTVIDFWRMIWQENVLIICMLTNVIENGKTKCEQYWPDIGNKKKYGNIIVLNAKQHVTADYCFRTFQITYGRETRRYF